MKRKINFYVEVFGKYPWDKNKGLYDHINDCTGVFTFILRKQMAQQLGGNLDSQLEVQLREQLDDQLSKQL